MLNVPSLSESPGKLTGEQTLSVMEVFYSLQGEGYHSGLPSFFIRLAGCSVGCHWCDVKESWDRSSHEQYSISKLLDMVGKGGPAKHVIITGGEPLEQNLTHLTGALKQKGYRVHLETAGTARLTGEFDWICLSPKKIALPKAEMMTLAHELKVVIYNQADLMFAEKMKKSFWTGLPNDKRKPVYLQPEWGRREKVVPMILDYIKLHPEWKISLQTHKYLGIR